ncbi:MAG: hypothetical protein ACFFDS_09865, partial [Candidatus Thorarchaeota archaeon]
MERQDIYKMFGLILAILFIIILGSYITNPTGHAVLECAEFKEPYITLEPYKEYGNEINWGYVYLKILEKVNINIPTNRPAYISYELCGPCKYNITFLSTLPTNFFVFDEYNKERYFDRKSAFPLVSEASSENKTFHFQLGEKGKYYFVFDRSSQGRNTNDPATGRLIIYELKGFNRTTV